MKNKINRFTFIMLFLFSIIAKADVPIIDIITLSINEKTFYMTAAEIGVLKNNDLCYYNYHGEFIEKVSETVKKRLKRKNVIFYEKLDVIDLSKLPIPKDANNDTYPDTLYILSQSINLKDDDIIGNFKVIAAIHGNTAGYTYTKELNDLDNHWLTNYEIEYVCPFYRENCEGALFGIKGNFIKKEILEIKAEIKRLKKDGKDLTPFLSKLYKENIIFIGQCSC